MTVDTTKSSLVMLLAVLLWNAGSSFSQVGPAEILNPALKAAERDYLSQLIAVNRAIAGIGFPFHFSLSRYAGLDPKDQAGTDARGLEFVYFHDRLVLKTTGNYNAAFSGELLTPNQRADRVFCDVVVPILQLLPAYFSARDAFDDFGFEIAYHARSRAKGFDYEGKEILVLVMGKADALSFGDTRTKRQEILNRSEIYLDGKPFGLALGAHDPFDIEALERSVRSPRSPSAPNETGAQPAVLGSQAPVPQTHAAAIHDPATQPPPMQPSPHETSPPRPSVETASPLRPDPDALQAKYQAQLDELGKVGVAKYHFVDYAPPAIVLFRNQISIQLTLRNPESFEKDAGSIYKRAAQSFDLFLAPRMKPVLDLLPASHEVTTLDITVINELFTKSGKSSEALEFVFSLQSMRRFVDAEITNQDLINEGLVLVNGVRIALNLQLVE